MTFIYIYFFAYLLRYNQNTQLLYLYVLQEDYRKMLMREDSDNFDVSYETISFL